MKQKILQIGAEAVILKKNKDVIKRRVKKSYRFKELDDKIRKRRTRSEAKLLDKASKFIPIPKIKKVDDESKEIIMEFIQGKKLSEHLEIFSLEKQKEICRQIGKNISRIHNNEIIHGDLTTSNMILVDGKKSKDKDKFKIYFIDFGLGFISYRTEDKAVDLHLLRQALEARHFKNWNALFAEVLKGYSNSKDYEAVLERLKKVEKRGRYKEKY